MTGTRLWMMSITASACLFGGLLAGCSTDDGGDATPSPSPEPSPTPTPTPEPNLDEQYRTDAFAIADAGVGFDLDNDGQVDNNLPIVFDTINASLTQAAKDACATAFPDNPAQQASCETAVLTALSAIMLDVDDLNNQLASLIQSGQLIYLERLSGTPSDASLAWYDGIKNNADAYVVNYSLGVQTGVVVGTEGEVGPGTFTYYLTDDLSFAVTNTLAEFTYVANEEGSSNGGLHDGLLGGAVLVSEIEGLLRDAIPSNTEQQQATEDEIVLAVLTAIDPYMDLELNGEKAFSVAFTFNTVWQPFAGY